MDSTLELLEKALKKKRAAAWARELGISSAAITQAKKRGNLSPVIAGSLAINLGENAQHWIAIAAIEAERASPLKDQMLQALLL